MDRSILPELTAPVRSGEEIDVAALSQYLGEAVEIEQFPNGHSNLVYLVRTAAQEYVLRRPPLGPVAPKAHDMIREARVLRALNPYFPESPRVLKVCEDPAVIGAPFFLMERRRGVVIRNGRPSREACEALIDCLARLHAIDVAIPEIATLGKPEGFVERQVRGWAERWERARTEGSQEMGHVIHWLRTKLPSSGQPSVVHNDFKFDNTLFTVEPVVGQVSDRPIPPPTETPVEPVSDRLAHAQPTRIEAILDWEMTTLGDPLADVGLTLCYWPTEVGEVYSRDEFVDRYARKTGRDMSAIGYHEVLGIFKLAVILQQIYYRYRNGQTTDERFRHLDDRVRDLILRAHDKALTS